MWGFVFIDSNDDDVKIWYFPVNDESRNIDQYDQLIECISNKGISNCTHFADLWSFEEKKLFLNWFIN